MNLEMLRVTNELYGLGLSKEDFKNAETLRKDPVKVSGKTVLAVSSKHLILINHKERVYEENTYLEGKDLKRGDVILFNKAVDFSVPGYVYVLNKHYPEAGFQGRFKNLKELEKTILESFPNRCRKISPADESSKTGEKSSAEAKRKRLETEKEFTLALFSFFGEEAETFLLNKCRINVPRVVKVFEKNNHRVGVLINVQDYHDTIRQGGWNRSVHIDLTNAFIVGMPYTDPRYNYLDLDREVVFHVDDGGFELWLDEKVTSGSEDLYAYLNLRNNRDDSCWEWITPEKMLGANRLIMLNKAKFASAKEAEQAEKLLRERMRQAFKNGSVSKKGFTFTPTSFSYDNKKVTGDLIEEYLVERNIIEMTDPSFLKIWEGYIHHVLEISVDTNYWPAKVTFELREGELKKFSVNKVKVLVENVGKRKATINGFKVHHWEVEYLAKKSIDYRTQKEYDAYLEFTSRFPLVIQNLSDQGYFDLVIGKNDYYGRNKEEDLRIRLRLKIQDDKLVCNIGEKTFNIKNKWSLLNLVYKTHTSTDSLVNGLNNSISKITPADIVMLIQEGKKLVEIAEREKKKLSAEKIKKSLAFIEHAVKVTNSKMVGELSYLVKGTSGTIYLVEGKGETDINVFACEERKGVIKNKKHLCIVDPEQVKEGWQRNDCIAKRILALSEDKKVADEIYTVANYLRKKEEGLEENDYYEDEAEEEAEA
jgi:hypothetical protein